MSIRSDGAFEIHLNEGGRDLLVKKLLELDGEDDHLHLEHIADHDGAPTDVNLSVIPYRSGDTCLEFGKVLYRPDDWDRQYFPHVLAGSDS